MSAAQGELAFDTPQVNGPCKAVLDYIDCWGSITALEAMRDLGVMRLASRISDLRNLGIEIESDRAVVTNRFGDKCHVARYTRRTQ